MLKKDELLNPNSCLNKADVDEPVFVLRAKDVLAPMAVRHWITMATGIHDPEKLKEAEALAQNMERWHAEKFPRMADPA